MKKFRPFWSYRIEETEKWLEEMLQAGYRLKQLQPLLRLFTFERVDSQVKRYLIDYKSPKGLYVEGGWKQLLQAHNWTVYEGEAPTRFSSREKVFQRIRTHYMLATVLLLVLFFYLNTAAGVLMALRFGTGFYLSAFLVLFVLFMCASLYLNKWYHTKEKAYLNIDPKVALHAIRKRRVGWMYVQFLTKRWLERMFAQGYELEYVKGMSFYFKPRESACISYEILNEKPKNSAALLFYSESGWTAKHLYSSLMWHISIWSKPYEVGEVKPRITYEQKERLKSMRRGLVNTNVLSVLFILVMTLNIFNSLNQMQNAYMPYGYSLALLILSSMVLLYWLWIFVQSVYGYMQEKKEAQEI
ncbi:MAG: DUF2812 domain-containing protein [Solibacillus sp.]